MARTNTDAADGLRVLYADDRRYALVVTELRFADLVAPGVAPGFDLDGLDSDGLDGTGCRHPDFEGPDGAPGIDNQLATLMPILRATEARAIDGLLQESVNGGSILFLVQLDGLDDWRDDDAVDLVLQSGAGPTPYLTTDGLIESDQTFALDPDARPNPTTATLVDGTLTAGPFDVLLPVSVLNASFDLVMPIGMVQLTFNPDGSADGLFGGALPISTVLDLAGSIDTSIRDLATNLLISRADLLPDADGRCTAISAWWTVHAERAFVADW